MNRNFALKVIFVFGAIVYLGMLLLACFTTVPFQETNLKPKAIHYSSQSSLIEMSDSYADSILNNAAKMYLNLNEKNSESIVLVDVNDTRYLGFQILFNASETEKVVLEDEVILYTSIH